MKPSRRGTGEVRELLLDSALRLFATRGYAATSTRQVAADAGVAETLLFRHFGTKAGLFRAAVLDQVGSVLDAYVDQWVGDPAGLRPPETLVGDLVSSLYDHLRAHRDLVIALLGARAFLAEEPAAVDVLRAPFRRLTAFARRELSSRGYEPDPEIAARLVVGMVASMAVLDDWFFPDREGSERSVVVAEMTRMIVHGITPVPGQESPEPS